MNSETCNEKNTEPLPGNFNVDREEDSEAKKFIQRSYQRKVKIDRVIMLVGGIMILGEITIWWLQGLISADALVRSAFFSLFPFAPFVIVFFVYSKLFLRHFRKDARHGNLKSISGSYEKCFAHGSGASLSGTQAIKIAGEKIYVPVTEWKALPDTGSVTVEYFPHTRLCWRLDGRVVRDLSDGKK